MFKAYTVELTQVYLGFFKRLQYFEGCRVSPIVLTRSIAIFEFIPPQHRAKKKRPIDPTLLPNVKLVAIVKISKNDLFFDQTMQSKKLKFRFPKYEAKESVKKRCKAE